MELLQGLELAWRQALFQFFQPLATGLVCSIESVSSPPWDAVGQAAGKACLGWRRACRWS